MQPGSPPPNSDHSAIQLIPTYRSALKWSKPASKTISVWQEGSKEQLSGCFWATDWEVFHEDNNNIDNIAGVITGYIHFCMDTIVPKKTMTLYPYNKDYIMPEIKQCIKRKKHAFWNNDTTEIRAAQKALTEKLRKAREEHSTRVRDAFSARNSRHLWDSIKEMTNLKSDKKKISCAVMKGKKQMNPTPFINVLILKGMIVFRKLLTTLTCDQLQDKIIIESSTVAGVF